MPTTKKLSHPDAADNSHADCPFDARIIDSSDKKPKPPKRPRTGSAEENDGFDKQRKQLSPFAPNGEFKGRMTMDVYYIVEPTRKWFGMKRYNSFILNGIKYHNEDFIYVANEFSIERHKALESKQPTRTSMLGSEKDWVARILEIRAADEHHVYARIYWMYWPDELPEHSMDGEKYTRGRQPYHGRSELIASNHMDVINVVSVTSPAQIDQMMENDNDDTQGALYWRQALNVWTNELSTVKAACSYAKPGNPTFSSDARKKTAGYTRKTYNPLMKTYERLGAENCMGPKRENGGSAPAAEPDRAGRGGVGPTIDRP
uniref:BAH domain-containing protein n=1 Tax=Pyricularia oryzae (strain P131) TaxID=1143193 RepID=L7J9Z5_PYRO1